MKNYPLKCFQAVKLKSSPKGEGFSPIPRNGHKEETYFAERSSPKSIPSKTKLLVIDEITTQKDLDQIAVDMKNGWPISEFPGQLIPLFLIIITHERFPLSSEFIEMDLDKNILTLKVQ